MRRVTTYLKRRFYNSLSYDPDSLDMLLAMTLPHSDAYGSNTLAYPHRSIVKSCV